MVQSLYLFVTDTNFKVDALVSMTSLRNLFVQTFFPRTFLKNKHAFASVHMQLHMSNLGISSQNTGILLTNLLRRGMGIRGEILQYMIVVKAQNCLVWSGGLFDPISNIIKLPSALATFFVSQFLVQSSLYFHPLRQDFLASPVTGEKNQSPNSTIWEDPFSMFCTWAAQPPVLCAPSPSMPMPIRMLHWTWSFARLFRSLYSSPGTCGGRIIHSLTCELRLCCCHWIWDAIDEMAVAWQHMRNQVIQVMGWRVRGKLRRRFVDPNIRKNRIAPKKQRTDWKEKNKR